jgi:hypothetical protein
MENITFDRRVGFEIKSPWGGDYGGGSISQIGCVGDTPDNIQDSSSCAIGDRNQKNPWAEIRSSKHTVPPSTNFRFDRGPIRRSYQIECL